MIDKIDITAKSRWPLDEKAPYMKGPGLKTKRLMSKNYWLLKSEPDVWSIDQQQKAGKKVHHGMELETIRLANNLEKMKKAILCFFYHSNIGKEIVGCRSHKNCFC